MLEALNAFYQSGMRRMIPDTDAESFTDAAKFYTSLGISIDRYEFLFEREIHAGQEIRRFERESGN